MTRRRACRAAALSRWRGRGCAGRAEAARDDGDPMAKLTRLVALAVGQGMAHLVEYYNDASSLTYPNALVLVDFGGNKKYASGANTHIVERLQAQKTAKLNPGFDLVVISHQDSDHQALLKSLQEAITAAGITPRIDRTSLGGLMWRAANKTSVTSFFKFASTPPPPSWTTTSTSHYDGATSRADLKSLFAYNGVACRVVISNHAVTTGGDDIVRNASSQVLVFEDGSASVVLPGDATWETMAYINSLYTEWETKKIASLIPQVKGLEIPHHGALRTAVEGYAATLNFSQLTVTILRDFIKNLSGKLVFASAGYLSTHGHPVLEVLKEFEGYTNTLPSGHSNVAYQFGLKREPRASRYTEYTTQRDVWTTLQTMNPVAWRNVIVDITTSTVGEPTTVTASLRTFEELRDEYAGRVRAAPSDPPRSTAAAPTAEERASAAQIAALPRRR